MARHPIKSIFLIKELKRREEWDLLKEGFFGGYDENFGKIEQVAIKLLEEWKRGWLI